MSFMNYLLKKRTGNRTYVGYTNAPKRRLRQHNREIKKGARATSVMEKEAEMVCCVKGFKDISSAMQFEWAWQKRKISGISQHRFRGVFGRIEKLEHLLCLEKVTENAPLNSTLKLEVIWFPVHIRGKEVQDARAAAFEKIQNTPGWFERRYQAQVTHRFLSSPSRI